MDKSRVALLSVDVETARPQHSEALFLVLRGQVPFLPCLIYCRQFQNFKIFSPARCKCLGECVSVCESGALLIQLADRERERRFKTLQWQREYLLPVH